VSNPGSKEEKSARSMERNQTRLRPAGSRGVDPKNRVGVNRTVGRGAGQEWCRLILGLKTEGGAETARKKTAAKKTDWPWSHKSRDGKRGMSKG